jgi:hypothetical protein
MDCYVVIEGHGSKHGTGMQMNRTLVWLPSVRRNTSLAFALVTTVLCSPPVGCGLHFALLASQTTDLQLPTASALRRLPHTESTAESLLALMLFPPC